MLYVKSVFTFIYQSTDSAHFNITSSLPRKIISSGISRIILNNIPKAHTMISPLTACWDLVSQEVPNPIKACFTDR